MKLATILRAGLVAAPLVVLTACGGGGDDAGPLGGDALKAVVYENGKIVFVGKGDVQTALGWNNKQLQDNAGNLDFRLYEVTVTERAWECTNDKNEKVQDRDQTTTTRVKGQLYLVERVRNQITGFTLNDDENYPKIHSHTSGQKLNSCPEGNWELTDPYVEGEETTTTTGNGLEVWDPLKNVWVGIKE